MQKKQGRGYWRKLVRAFERSGLEQKIFCERQGVPLNSFKYWLYKLRREERAQSTALVQVQMPAAMGVPSQLEAGLPSGVVLRFSSGTDPQYVAALVSEVERARC